MVRHSRTVSFSSRTVCDSQLSRQIEMHKFRFHCAHQICSPMKVLHAFQTTEQANLAVSFLEAEGIDAYIWDQNVSSLYPLFNPAIGMVRVAVDEEQFEEAEYVMESYFKLLQQGQQQQ